MRRPRRPAQDLRLAIECLPRHTRVAMLEGVDAGDIIVGAYTDSSGGVCPMLAAHRRGGRTSLASFARAWDRYTRAGKRSRRATGRELHTLRTMLETSLLRDDGARDELAQAVAELEAIKSRRLAAEREESARPRAEAGESDARGDASASRASERRPRADTGERDRSGELSLRPGWSWLRVFRRYDEYEAALERLERAEREVERRQVEHRELERV